MGNIRNSHPAGSVNVFYERFRYRGNKDDGNGRTDADDESNISAEATVGYITVM